MKNIGIRISFEPRILTLNFEKHIRALWLICRFETLIGYNLAYFGIIIALVLISGNRSDLLDPYQVLILILFFASVISAKSQASIADTLCDYNNDKDNPSKSYVSNALETFGFTRSKIAMYINLGGSLLLASIISILIGKPLIFVLIAIFNILGYCYSYRPRIKERGIWNIIVTSAVDVFCIVFAGYYLIITNVSEPVFILLAIIFLYSSSFHIMHMTGDIYEDRRSGTRTYASNLGTRSSLLISGFLALGAVPLSFNFPIFMPILIIYATKIFYLNNKVKFFDVEKQGKLISSQWSTGFWATFLNFGLAASIFFTYIFQNL